MKDSITITRKMMYGIVPLAVVLGIVLAKGGVGPAILLIIGSVCGIIIGRFSTEKSES